MENKITYCEDCPFNVSGGEYSGYCNHPLAPEGYDKNDEPLAQQKSIHYDFGVPENKMPKTNTTSYGYYHFETNVIPKWCPLRQLSQINIGIIIKINLDKQLFEENYEH